jgi:Mn-dependent DtxR family transcriptional regulator
VIELTKNRDFHTFRGYEIIDKQQKTLTRSMEDYLEMIYRNSAAEGYTRINTLSESLNVQASSATKMAQKLHLLGFIRYRKYGIIQLTKEGEKLGKFLYERHLTVERFLSIIGVKEDLLMNAELIEHSISPEALKRIETLVSFFESNPDLLARLNEFAARQ